MTDDLLGPAQGPEEEIVGMSVRDRYILGRLGPRRVDDLGGPAPTNEEIQEADESADENKDGNEDHAEHDEKKTPGTDIAEEEPEEDMTDTIDVTRSSSIVPSSLGLIIDSMNAISSFTPSTRALLRDSAEGKSLSAVQFHIAVLLRSAAASGIWPRTIADCR